MSKKKGEGSLTHTVERERNAILLRKAGAGYEQIAHQLGYANAGGAYKAVMRGLHRSLREPTEELLTLELTRLDDLWKSLQQTVLKGSPRAVEVCLQIMDRRARYLGMDAPTKIIAITADLVNAELERLRTEIATLERDGSQAGGSSSAASKALPAPKQAA